MKRILYCQSSDFRNMDRQQLLDSIAGSEGRDPYEDYLAINHELEKYGETVSKIPQIIALNKCDMLENDDKIEEFKGNFEISPIPNSEIAYKFWKKVVRDYTNDNYKENNIDNEIIFTFENK